MGKRQKILAQILSDNGISLLYPFDFDRTLFYNSEYNEAIFSVYRELGGVLDTYPIGFGDFDIITNDCFIELDEENHFNRYRATTLKSNFYLNCPNFSKQSYIDYCNQFENKAGKGGNFWTTPNSEKQFGISSKDGDWSGNGSSRWKQRAFYDFLRDVYSSIQDKPVYRFSIYDKVGVTTINSILQKQKKELYLELYDLISSQME